ncbi:MAG: hypothetical protein E7411_02420 [Ruminococcaceae bacterium]|nr:hypothetical protein [Oscillospiraceae bacterium]
MVIYVTAKITGNYTSLLRIAVASIIGAIIGVFAFEKIFFGVYGVFISFLMLYIAFSFFDIKSALIFFMVIFILGGISFFINNIFNRIVWIGAVAYTENSLLLSLLFCILCVVSILLFFRLFKRLLIKKNMIKKINIGFEGKNVDLYALMDTGNLLLDPVTGYPVVLVFFEKIKGILPEPLKLFMESENGLLTTMDRKYKNKICLIPYKTAGDESILKGFRPDYVILKDNKERVIKNVIVAVVFKKMSADNEFEAVLNPQI